MEKPGSDVILFRAVEVFAAIKWLKMKKSRYQRYRL